MPEMVSKYRESEYVFACKMSDLKFDFFYFLCLKNRSEVFDKFSIENVEPAPGAPGAASPRRGSSGAEDRECLGPWNHCRPSTSAAGDVFLPGSLLGQMLWSPKTPASVLNQHEVSYPPRSPGVWLCQGPCAISKMRFKMKKKKTYEPKTRKMVSKNRESEYVFACKMSDLKFNFFYFLCLKNRSEVFDKFSTESEERELKKKVKKLQWLNWCQEIGNLHMFLNAKGQTCNSIFSIFHAWKTLSYSTGTNTWRNFSKKQKCENKKKNYQAEMTEMSKYRESEYVFACKMSDL